MQKPSVALSLPQSLAAVTLSFIMLHPRGLPHIELQPELPSCSAVVARQAPFARSQVAAQHHCCE